MQKFRPYNIYKFCLAIFGLALLTQTVFGYENNNKISYLDSITNTYTNNQNNIYEQSILNMNSDEARGFETTLMLDSSPIITNAKTKIDISLRDSDLKQTLRMIADKAKMNIVFDPSVDGKITLDLNNVTLNEAFLIIFKATQLTYSLDGNTITVATLEASKNLAYKRKSMTVLPVKYANSDNVASFLNSNLFSSNIFGLSNAPIVTSNPANNQIIIFGNTADVNAIKRILPIIDIKPMINSFNVNHTTPKEMANLICNSLVKISSGSDSNSDSDSNDSSNEDDNNSDSTTLKLGGGKIACRAGNSEDGGSSGGTTSSDGGSGLAAFKATPLTVAYFSSLGKIETYGGSVEQVEAIKQFIKDHDKKQLMAYVELSVIELNETGSKRFSNQWSLWTPFLNLTVNNTGMQITAPIWDHEYRRSQGMTSNNKGLLYSLQYAIENRNGRVLTNPKIMVTNGAKSTIDLTSDYVKTVTSQIIETSSGTVPASQKTYEIGSDEGLLIELTPFISPDGYVVMNITPEFATIKEKVPGNDNGIAATLLQRRDLELKNIRIKDGETLVLAGLIKENEEKSSDKVPVLSDLPFIGTFFRSNSSERAREELVILITPHIIKDEQDTNEKVYDL